jgi:hypothetical protein
MVNKKLELTFTQGFFLGLVVMFFIASGLVETYFVSKDVFNLNNIYIDGKIYQLCRVR